MEINLRANITVCDGMLKYLPLHIMHALIIKRNPFNEMHTPLLVSYNIKNVHSRLHPLSVYSAAAYSSFH